ncbi:ATP-binding protein [Actinokineospora auranticolor]|uniref:Serine/threonine-protein kinase RsbW n=1 Tax=Actinokineospora auranticolor TaxID=155976 RepID=A0A2S6GCX3_9PSEU|nr:ATP-binding protein [Actinokineospora auranticolor]PPK63103.1 serine/threonine-protein kinase RsbW [Actinokineospora auranticolor]
MPDTPRPDVDLRLRADLANLPIVRGVAATVAMGADFTVDAIADLRLAVDEVCSQLIVLAAPGADLECRFTREKAGVTFIASTRSNDGRTPNTDTFGWHVLRTLAEEVDTGLGDGVRPPVHITIHKRRD